MQGAVKEVGARQTYALLCNRLKELSHLSGISSVLSWDAEVIMPHGSAAIRGQHTSILAGITHERKTAPELGSLIKSLETAQSPEFNEYELAVIRDAKRDYEHEVLIPKELAQKSAELQTRGYQVWVEARKNNDFASFAPVLKEWVGLRLEICRHIDARKPAYDVCIDHFERGMTSARYDEIFSQVKEGILPLIARIVGQTKSRGELEFDQSFLTSASFDVKSQAELGKEVSGELGFDFEHGRMDVSAHPFTGGPHPTDVRITTRYSGNLLEGLMGTVHETGHALYEQGRNTDYADLPVSCAHGMGIHESQSLLYERMVGQSKPFWKRYWPIILSRFPAIEPSRTWEDAYKAVNVVKPSLIRVDADEVTYFVHVLIRFELERAIFNEGLAVEDLPRLWREKLKAYLGVEPPTDREGVLQDVHWSEGLFGYFPSYSLGAMFACQFYNKAKEEIEGLEDKIAAGEFAPLRKWLKEKIHTKGSLYVSGDDLCKTVTGEPLNPAHFLNYLTQKYTELYNLE